MRRAHVGRFLARLLRLFAAFCKLALQVFDALARPLLDVSHVAFHVAHVLLEAFDAAEAPFASLVFFFGGVAFAGVQEEEVFLFSFQHVFVERAIALVDERLVFLDDAEQAAGERAIDQEEFVQVVRR